MKTLKSAQIVAISLTNIQDGSPNHQSMVIWGSGAVHSFSFDKRRFGGPPGLSGMTGSVTELYCNREGVVESELACRLCWYPVVDGLSSFRDPASQPA